MGKPLTNEDISVFYGQASQDLIDFCIATDRNYDPQWFHESIASALQKLESREIKRLIMEMPPRHGKSQLTTVNFPAWYLGRRPEERIITASYSDDLARKFGAEARDLMETEYYRNIFPNVFLRQDSRAKDYWRTNQGGGYMATGVGGAATGFGANCLVIDDAVRNAEDADSEVKRETVWNWYTSVARTRLEKDGVIVVIMTRWHSDDLIGRILEREALGGEKWHRITFPAIAEVNDRYRDVGEALWPGKYDEKALKDIRHDIGERAWHSLYQQTPIASETQIFRPEWMKKEFDPAELDGKVLNRYITIDTADTDREGADYIGVTVVDWDSENRWYFTFVKRYRLNILGLVDLVFNLWEEWKPQKIGVEKKSFEDQLKPLLDEQKEERGVFPVVVQLEDRGRRKEARIIGALQGRFEKEKIYFKRNAKDDTQAMKRELFDFPKGRNDDLIDAAAYVEQIGQRPFTSDKFIIPSLQNEIDDFRKGSRKPMARSI